VCFAVRRGNIHPRGSTEGDPIPGPMGQMVHLIGPAGIDPKGLRIDFEKFQKIIYYNS
jgi:hypothetical protein